jgi:hypothetical protein
MPLMLSCKDYHNIAVEELYRNIRVSDNPETIVKLMEGPPLSSYQHMETMDLRRSDNLAFPDIQHCITSRVIQSQGSALEQYGRGPRWNLSTAEAARFGAHWSSVCKPRLNVLKVHGSESNMATKLLQL